MAIVKHILEGHQSKISVSSTVGKGSMFSFSLPSIKEKVLEKIIRVETFTPEYDELLSKTGVELFHELLRQCLLDTEGFGFEYEFAQAVRSFVSSRISDAIWANTYKSVSTEFLPQPKIVEELAETAIIKKSLDSVVEEIPSLVLYIANYGTLALELTFPVMVCHPRLKNITLLLCFCMHLFIYSFMMIYAMSIIFVMQYGMFYSNDTMLSLAARIKSRFVKRK